MSERRPHHPRRHRRRADPVQVSAMMSRFRRMSGAPSTSAGSLPELAALWVRVVGEQAAAHSEPVRRSRAGVVSVVCTSAAWAQELTFRREELLERLRDELGDASALTGLRFSVADHVAGAPAREASERTPPRRAPRPTSADRQAGEREAEGIDNREIRALIARLAASARARDAGR